MTYRRWLNEGSMLISRWETHVRRCENCDGESPKRSSNPLCPVGRKIKSQLNALADNSLYAERCRQEAVVAHERQQEREAGKAVDLIALLRKTR